MAAFAYFNAGTRAAVFTRAAAAKGYFSTYQRTVVPVGGVATQRIEGGSQMYKKNTSAKFAFKAVDSAGLAVTGLTITAKTGKDGAAPAPASNSVVESGSGWYYITLTSTEMNGDLIVLDLSASGATIAPITISTESDYTAARAAFLTGDTFARLGAPAGASVSADIANIAIATNAGDMATKQADSATLTTGSNTSGSFASTASNDSVYWITAPVTPAVGGFGLRQQLVFDLPLGRTPVGIQVRGYWNGSSQSVDVYALNSRTGVFDKLTNSSTNMASRNADALYAIPLPRDYSDDSGGSFNIVTLEFRSASTNTAHRLRVDQILIAHVAEDVAVTSTAPTAEQIWSYVTRELTSPGAEPVTVPTAAEVADEVQTRTIAAVTTVGSVTGLTAANLDVAVSTRLASAGYTAPDNASITAVKAKTDNLPSDPADESLIIAATDAIASLIGAGGANLTALGDTRLAHLDADVSSSSAPTAAENAAALLASAVEGAITVLEALRLHNAALGGKASGLATTTATYRDLSDSKDRIVATVDADGNRSAVSLDLT